MQKHQINRWEDRCPGSPVKIGDQVFTESGKYEVIFKNTSPYDCDSIVSLTLQIADTSQPIIQCVQDTFLNNISINWDRKDLADNYQVFINDSLVSSQSFVGYIYNPNFVGEEIDIKIQPSWALGCDFAPGYATCTAAILSNSREVSGKNDAIVFPNPSSGTFEILSEEKIERIEVLDFSGKERKVVFESTFSLANLVSGVYLLKIRFQNNDKTIFRKVLKI